MHSGRHRLDLPLIAGACAQASNPAGFQCINDGDCPPACECENDFVYACLGPELGDLGDPCQANAECDPTASSLGAFCCLDEAACGSNLNQCVEDCSMYSSGGIPQEIEGAICQDNTECGEFLFCCLVPNAAGNCDFGQDQSCTCRGMPGQ